MLMVWQRFPSSVKYYPKIAADLQDVCSIVNTGRYILFLHGLLIWNLLEMEKNL